MEAAVLPKGVLNQVLGFFGLPDSTAWLGNPKTALGTLIALGVWQFGSSMLIFLAAIKNIPQSYHEAAIVDLCRPCAPLLLHHAADADPHHLLQPHQSGHRRVSGVQLQLLITGGKPLNTTLYYGVYLYNKAFNQFEMGYGSAMAWFMLLIIAFFTALIFRSSSAWVYYESEGR